MSVAMPALKDGPHEITPSFCATQKAQHGVVTPMPRARGTRPWLPLFMIFPYSLLAL